MEDTRENGEGTERLASSFSMIRGEHCTLQRSSMRTPDSSISCRMAGSFWSSSQALPQPSTRERSLPVPSGTVPIIHCRREGGGRQGVKDRWKGRGEDVGSEEGREGGKETRQGVRGGRTRGEQGRVKSEAQGGRRK